MIVIVTIMVIFVRALVNKPFRPPEIEWSVAEAKAKLSEVIERAQSLPQLITRNGKPAALVISVAEWNRAKEALAPPEESLASFFARSPLREGPLDFSEPPGFNRDSLF